MNPLLLRNTTTVQADRQYMRGDVLRQVWKQKFFGSHFTGVRLYAGSMRFLLYNIRYGTGRLPLPFPWSGYFRRTAGNMADIQDFICSHEPDIVGLVEVDSGSYRTGGINQAEQMACGMSHYHAYRSKYADGHFAHRVPLMNRQGNAFVVRDGLHQAQFHYFTQGIKRLVIELEFDYMAVYLVHLALTAKVRQRQLRDLYELVGRNTKPKIVAGDFNVFWGDREMHEFLGATGLVNANVRNEASFPSWAPTRQLDFILYSPEIKARRFWIPRVSYSDHLPLVFDFDLPESAARD